MVPLTACVSWLLLSSPIPQDLEKALSKRELIAMKGRATIARAKQSSPANTRGSAGSAALTRGQLDKAVGDLEKSVKDTEREVRICRLISRCLQ